MKLGDRGAKVEEVQEILRSLELLKGEEDGYRIKTKQAVIAYQKALGLEPTGEWDDSMLVLMDYYITTIAAPNIVDSATQIGVAGIVGAEVALDSASKASLPKGTAGFTVDPIPCYIYNLNTGKKIIFDLESPDSISDNITANFDAQSPRGRSSPFQGYGGSGPRTLDFSIELSADYCTEGIVQTCDSLRALCYPHNATVIVEPKCLFRLGRFLSVKAVPNSVGVEWRKPYKDGIYTLATVSISLSEVEDTSKFAKEVEK